MIAASTFSLKKNRQKDKFIIVRSMSVSEVESKSSDNIINRPVIVSIVTQVEICFRMNFSRTRKYSIQRER